MEYYDATNDPQLRQHVNLYEKSRPKPCDPFCPRCCKDTREAACRGSRASGRSLCPRKRTVVRECQHPGTRLHFGIGIPKLPIPPKAETPGWQVEEKKNGSMKVRALTEYEKVAREQMWGRI